MKTFICILVLAVASCKAGYESNNYSGSQESDSSSNSGSSEGGYDYSAPITHNLAAQAQSHDQGNQGYAGGQSQNFGGHQFAGQSHDFSGSQGHENSQAQGGHEFLAALNQIHTLGQGGHAFPQFQQYHAPQARGFDVGSHGDFSFAPSGHDFQGQDSYLQAAHDLGNFYHGGQGQGGHEEQSGSQEDHSAELGGQSDGGHGQQTGDYGTHGQGFILQDGGDEYGHGEEQNAISNDGHDLGGLSHAFPVGEHVDVESPVSVPQYKHVTYPIPKTVHVNVPKPILVGVPQPYPVKVPVHKPVAVPVETEINIPVEKVVPYPVVKHVPYPVEKHVPIKIEKTVTVHVPQPYPVKIPVYKTIHHHKDH